MTRMRLFQKLIPCCAVFIMALVVLSGCGGEPPLAFSIPESLVPATSTTSFPTGEDDLGGNCTTVNVPYYMARTEVTYALWATVRDWADDNSYIFTNQGGRGAFWPDGGVMQTYTDGHATDPVTCINWYNAVIWCNALTEYYNDQNGTSLACVYQSGGTVLRDAADTTALAAVVPLAGAKGFRLPTGMEWQMAARYKDGSAWTPGEYASGATADHTNTAATDVVSWRYASVHDTIAHEAYIKPVGLKAANALGLKDMSGNVWEWCFDLRNATDRFILGGSNFNADDFLAVGHINSNAPNSYGYNLGFRPVRTK